VIEYVRTASSVASRIEPTTALESMPPERKAPIGTSETRWEATASSSRASSASVASPRLAGALAEGKLTSQ
jgi:hypothetical protein